MPACTPLTVISYRARAASSRTVMAPMGASPAVTGQGRLPRRRENTPRSGGVFGRRRTRPAGLDGGRKAFAALGLLRIEWPAGLPWQAHEGGLSGAVQGALPTFRHRA